MRVSGATLTGLALFASITIVQLTTVAGAAAAPPPGAAAGAVRNAYTSATCSPGFSPNPATYPASSANVKYQCFGTASCPPQFTSGSYSKTTPNPLLFEYSCTRTGSVLPAGKATCAAGFVPSIPAYQEGEKLVYYCDTKPVTCPSTFSVVDNDADSGASPGPPPKFFYACISSGPH